MMISTGFQTVPSDFAACSYLMSDFAAAGERRRGLRLQQNRPVKIYEPMTGRYIAGHTNDVSVTGLRIALPKSSLLRPGCFVHVHVGISEGGQPLANRREMIAARVVWINPKADPTGRTISAGVEFTASIAAHRDAA